MKFTFITLFPELIESWCRSGLIGTAVKRGLVSVATINPRDFTEDVHKTVDNTAFGGSDGMVLKFEPMARALDCILSAGVDSRVAFLSPQGPLWTQKRAEECLGQQKHLILVCGRYAGFDQRLLEVYADDEISVGDYVLNGGEVAGLVVLESIARLIPGVLGNSKSATRESFGVDGLLECPCYTRPREIAGLAVPSPLLSGNHSEIERFERDVALLRTMERRPEIIQTLGLDGECEKALARLSLLPASERKSLGLVSVGEL